MEEMKKLSVVIEHWVKHNQDHMSEYRNWAQTANKLGLERINLEIEKAIEKLSQCNGHLQNALKGLSSSL